MEEEYYYSHKLFCNILQTVDVANLLLVFI